MLRLRSLLNNQVALSISIVLIAFFFAEGGCGGGGSALDTNPLGKYDCNAIIVEEEDVYSVPELEIEQCDAEFVKFLEWHCKKCKDCIAISSNSPVKSCVNSTSSAWEVGEPEVGSELTDVFLCSRVYGGGSTITHRFGFADGCLVSIDIDGGEVP